MVRVRSRGTRAGFALVEVAVSSVVLAVALAGLVVSIVYSHNLGEQSRHLWRATTAATATLEEIRSQSMTHWSSVTDWNGKRCDFGVGSQIDPYASTLAAEVDADAGQLTRPNGMWSTGATTPNFYFVDVHTAGSADDFANSLVFETYVADRGGLRNLADTGGTTAGSGGTPGSPTPTPTTDAGFIATTPTNVVYAGSPLRTLTFNVANAASKALTVTAVNVASTSPTKIGYLALNGVALYDNLKKPTANLTVSNVQKALPGIAPGLVTLSVTSSTNGIQTSTLTFKLTLSDGSAATVAVKP